MKGLQPSDRDTIASAAMYNILVRPAKLVTAVGYCARPAALNDTDTGGGAGTEAIAINGEK